MVSESFRKYLEEAIGSDNALVAFSAFDRPASVSVRMNPSKPLDMEGTGAGLPWDESRIVPWNPLGRILAQRPVFTLDPAFHAGAYYVQESSSMFVGHVFRTLLKDIPMPAGRPLRVLDLCAAPGGKTTDLAASLRSICGDGFILVANEVMKQRAAVLADNVAVWGDPNVVVTSDDPRAFSSLAGFFDVIVADVPCSGEGMFRKDEEARRQWSEDNVALCTSRQRRIVADVWPSLSEGGIFIYSTCTFNRYENDGNVGWIAEELGAGCLVPDVSDMPGVLPTRFGYSLVPGFVEGEGQYCAALSRTSGQCSAGRMQQKGLEPLPESMSRLFCSPMMLRRKGELAVAVPAVIAAALSVLERHLHVISAGCAVGVLKGQTLVPDADLALSSALVPEAYPSVDVDRDTALAFLHRDPVVFPDAPKGHLLLRYGGLGLGFVKNLGNRCNSLLPQGRRIRMSI